MRTSHLRAEAYAEAEAARQAQQQKESKEKAVIDQALVAKDTHQVLSSASAPVSGASIAAKKRAELNKKKRYLKGLFAERTRLREFLDSRVKQGEITFRREDELVFAQGAATAKEDITYEKFLSHYNKKMKVAARDNAKMLVAWEKERCRRRRDAEEGLQENGEMQVDGVRTALFRANALLQEAQQGSGADGGAGAAATLSLLLAAWSHVSRVSARVDQTTLVKVKCESCEKLRLMRGENAAMTAAANSGDGQAAPTKLQLPNPLSPAASLAPEGAAWYRQLAEFSLESLSAKFFLEKLDLGALEFHFPKPRSSLPREVVNGDEGLAVMMLAANYAVDATAASPEAKEDPLASMEIERKEFFAEEIKSVFEGPVFSTVASPALYREVRALRRENDAHELAKSYLGGVTESEADLSLAPLRSFLSLMRRQFHVLVAEITLSAQQSKKIYVELFEVGRRIDRYEASGSAAERAAARLRQTNKAPDNQFGVLSEATHDLLREKFQTLLLDRDRHERKTAVAMYSLLDAAKAMLGRVLSPAIPVEERWRKVLVDGELVRFEKALKEFARIRGFTDLEDVEGGRSEGGGRNRIETVFSSFFVGGDSPAPPSTTVVPSAQNHKNCVLSQAAEFSDDLYNPFRGLLRKLAEFDFNMKQRAPAIALGILAKEYSENGTTTAPILTKLHSKVVEENAVLLGPYEGLTYGATALSTNTGKEERNKLIPNNSVVLAIFFAKTQVRKKEVMFYRSLEVLSALFSTVLESMRCGSPTEERAKRLDGKPTQKLERLARFLHQLFFDRLFVDIQHANSVAFLLDASGRNWGVLSSFETNSLRATVELPALEGGGAPPTSDQEFFVIKNLRSHRALLALLNKQTVSFEKCVDSSPQKAELVHPHRKPNLWFLSKDIATHNYGICLRGHLNRRIALKKRKMEGASSMDDVVALQLLDKILEFFKKVKLVPKAVQQDHDHRAKFTSQLVSQLKQAEQLWLKSGCDIPTNKLFVADDQLRTAARVPAARGDEDIRVQHDPDYASEFSAVLQTVSHNWGNMMKKLDAAAVRVTATGSRSATSSDELALELQQRVELERNSRAIELKLQTVPRLEEQQKAWWGELQVVVPKVLSREKAALESATERQTAMETELVSMLAKVFQKKVTDTLKSSCGMKPDFVDRMKTLRVRFAQWLPAALNIQKELMRKDQVITAGMATPKPVDRDMVHQDFAGPPVVLDEVLDIFVMGILHAEIPGAAITKTYDDHDNEVRCGRPDNCDAFQWKTTYRERLAVRIWQEADRFVGQEDKIDAMLAYSKNMMKSAKLAMGDLLGGKPNAKALTTKRTAADQLLVGRTPSEEQSASSSVDVNAAAGATDQLDMGLDAEDPESLHDVEKNKDAMGERAKKSCQDKYEEEEKANGEDAVEGKFRKDFDVENVEQACKDFKNQMEAIQPGSAGDSMDEITTAARPQVKAAASSGSPEATNPGPPLNELESAGKWMHWCRQHDIEVSDECYPALKKRPDDKKNEGILGDKSHSAKCGCLLTWRKWVNDRFGWRSHKAIDAVLQQVRADLLETMLNALAGAFAGLHARDCGELNSDRTVTVTGTGDVGELVLLNDPLLVAVAREQRVKSSKFPDGRKTRDVWGGTIISTRPMSDSLYTSPCDITKVFLHVSSNLIWMGLVG